MPELHERDMPEAEECLAMTEEEFKARFNDTAVFRTGLKRLQRNATVVLNNRRRLQKKGISCADRLSVQ